MSSKNALTDQEQTTRTLPIGEKGKRSLDEEKVEELIEELHLLRQASNEPVTLVINCKGGETFPSLRLYEEMMTLRAEGMVINGVVKGACYSAAVTILQGCTKRTATRRSRFIVHSAEAAFKLRLRVDYRPGHLAYLDQLDELNRQHLAILYERTGKEDEVKVWVARGDAETTSFYAPEAHRLNLIDEIIEF